MSLRITLTVVTALLFLSIPGVNAQTFTPFSNPNSPINTIDLRGFYRGCAWIDIDNDGDLDFFTNGGQRGQNGPRGLYKNDLNNDNHWVNIHCKGTTSNRAALGTAIAEPFHRQGR